MNKFIRVVKGSKADRDKSWEWRNTCKKLKIPYVAVLVDEHKVSIGASIIHLLNIPGLRLKVDTAQIDKQLEDLSKQFSTNIKGYWNFNDLYHLLDFVPEAASAGVSEQVYNILASHLNYESK